MTQTPVPRVGLTGQQDDVELINRVLRDAGHPVHCHWVNGIDSLAEALQSVEPELLWFFTDNLPASIEDVAAVKNETAPAVPLLVVSRAVEENDLSTAMLAGAQDLISAGQSDRLRRVAERELRAFRLERALNDTLVSATQYKKQLKTLVAGSVDAIAYAQEGILVDANQAWAELYGEEDADALRGPLMDLFDSSSQVAMRGALSACASGRWDSKVLKVTAAIPGGGAVPFEVTLEAVSLENEPAVKLCVKRQAPQATPPEQLVERAIHMDPVTGFYHRRRFLEVLAERLAAAPRSGVRALAFIRPDKFGEIEEEVGPLGSEDILVKMAEHVRESVHAGDVCGRFGGTVFAVLLERGTLRDIEAWAENAVARIADHIFEAAQSTLSITCTIGLAEVGPGTNRIDRLIKDAEKANQRGRQRGGNQVVLEETSDESTRIQRSDQFWAQQVKAALMENRFRLVHLPMVSLGGDAKTLLDTVLRMVDQQGDEVPAAGFMPAAQRNRLVRAIDRWVIDATLSFCSRHAPHCVFVKLSAESVSDDTLLEWLAKLVEQRNVEPAKLCFQVSEEDAPQRLKQTMALAEQLRSRGFNFAIEHFGIGRDPLRILSQIPMQYMKIDGSLMEGIATNQALQAKVREYVAAARKRKIATIAERVEDANTMAVLFQLGVMYMQGHYVHEPEVVLEDTIRLERISDRG